MDRKSQVIIISSILTGIGTLVVALRMFCRRWITNQLGRDDWVMLAAWFFTVVYLGIIGLSTRYGQGLPQSKQKPEWLEPALKCVLAIEIVYYIIVYLIKSSILLFYLRLGRYAIDWFHKSAVYTIYLLTLFLLICLTVVFIQCIPIERNWNIFLPGAVCINTTAFFYSTSVFNIITDVWILVLPMKLLWKVRRPTIEKLALVAVFAMGVFTCVASCVRLYTIEIFTKSPDPLYDAVPINIWSMIEINVAIICASVPAVKVMFGMRPSNSGDEGAGMNINDVDIGACEAHVNGGISPGPNYNNNNNKNSKKNNAHHGIRFPLRQVLKHSKLSMSFSTTLNFSGSAGDSEEQITGVTAVAMPAGLQSTTTDSLQSSGMLTVQGRSEEDVSAASYSHIGYVAGSNDISAGKQKQSEGVYHSHKEETSGNEHARDLKHAIEYKDEETSAVEGNEQKDLTYLPKPEEDPSARKTPDTPNPSRNSNSIDTGMHQTPSYHAC